MKGKQLEIVWSPEAIRQLMKIRKWKSKESIELYLERIKDLIEDIQKSAFEGIGNLNRLNIKSLLVGQEE
jgi:Txe/YoeB family toxin of Txe-Axe toxin-antitoxin module